MSSTDTSTLRAEGGLEVPVEWVYQGAEAFEWKRDREHWPSPMLPMELWLHKHQAAGSDRAWEEAAMDAPAAFYRFQCAGPFLYARESPDEPERMVRMALRYREVSRQHGGALAFWETVCRPRIEQVSREMSQLDRSAQLLDIAELCGYGFHQTFTSLALLFEPGMRLAALLAAASGGDVPLSALELVQSGETATLAVDTEIWELAELAKRIPPVETILEAAADHDVLPALRREPDAAPFVTAFDVLIERHGSRSQGWELLMPTWRERPQTPLSLIRARLGATGPSPAELASASEARQREAKERLLEQLTPDKRDEFSRLLAELDGYVRIREDRAYWQMVLTGEVRGVLLRIGARLVASGGVDRADDVLFLEPDDFEDGRPRDLRPLVAERKREWERWRQVTPPEVIGTPSTAQAPAEAPGDELRGSAASRGVATGPARIIHNPQDAERLRPGDILVCVMSTPAWTPLFAVVAAIVTETGGPLSHPAITAREYGIPAVVAVKDATVRIREGQIVTVDGVAGTVSLHS